MKTVAATLLKGAALVIVAATAACARSSAPLSVEDPWIREAPPDAHVLAGYVLLHNHTQQPVACSGASSPAFGAIEIHRTLVENGQSRMLRDQVVDVPAGGSAALAPGGYHLMMFRPQHGLVAGDVVPVSLSCGALQLEARFVVRPAP